MFRIWTWLSSLSLDRLPYYHLTMTRFVGFWVDCLSFVSCCQSREVQCIPSYPPKSLDLNLFLNLLPHPRPVVAYIYQNINSKLQHSPKSSCLQTSINHKQSPDLDPHLQLLQPHHFSLTFRYRSIRLKRRK